MGFGGDGQQFAVALAVAVGNDMPAGQVGKDLAQAFHLLDAIAVGREKLSRHHALLDFYLGADDAGVGEERLYPSVDAGTDDGNVAALLDGGLYLMHPLVAQQMAVGEGKLLAVGVKFLFAHALEEIGKDALLGLPVGIEVEFHQHQQGGMEQKAPQQASGAVYMADESQKGIGSGQCTVEIECV